MSFSDRPFRPVANSLRQQNPAITLEKEMAVSVGNGLLKLVDLASPEAAGLDNLDAVQVAVYRVEGADALAVFNEAEFQTALVARDGSLLWEAIVKVNDDNERVWIYAGMDLTGQRLVALSMFMLELDQLVLTHVEGDLDGLLRYALQPMHERSETTL